mgnify:CR=1 FL=1
MAETEDDIDIALLEDNAQEWNHQLELERRMQMEEKASPDPHLIQVLEDIRRAVALLQNIPERQYPVVADLRKRLEIEAEFLSSRQTITLNNLVKAARGLLGKFEKGGDEDGSNTEGNF